jgi:hypothetical protein
MLLDRPQRREKALPCLTVLFGEGGRVGVLELADGKSTLLPVASSSGENPLAGQANRAAGS